MRYTEFITEHSNWPIDPTVTAEDILKCKKAMIAVNDYAKTRGFSINITNHVYDQISRKRGFGKIDAHMMMRIFSKIFNRGLHLFKGKDDGFEVVFNDPDTGLYVPFRKLDDARYLVTTIVRDDKWLAPGEVVRL